MKYLAYVINGFQRKFPLASPLCTIGRGPDNDLVIVNEFISRVHLKIQVEADGIVIRDNDTANGTFVREKKIKEAKLQVGESFIVGGVEFFLKRGVADEFLIAEGFQREPADAKSGSSPVEANLIQTNIFRQNIYQQLLFQLIAAGINQAHFSDLLSLLPTLAAPLEKTGSLLVVSLHQKEPVVQLALTPKHRIADIDAFIKKFPLVFSQMMLRLKSQDEFPPFLSFPVRRQGRETCLIFVFHQPQAQEDRELISFLSLVSRAVEIISALFDERLSTQPAMDLQAPVQEAMVARSLMMKDLIQQAKILAASDIFVLIEGESGTGKELFARMIHQFSVRREKLFVALNCAAIPETLLESELFGSEKGAFTSSVRQQRGKLELASGGTLVLDEIGDMPLNLQAKLLRALQEKEFYRLGGSDPIQVDLRIISLTNRNLKQLVKDKQFRQDLYYRLVHRNLFVPPLRERAEDIPVLIQFFTRKFCQEQGKDVKGYSVRAFELLQAYSWPGNIRQLENEIRSVINLSEPGGVIDHEMLSEDVRQPGETVDPIPGEKMAPGFNVKPDRDMILKTLEQYNWNKSQAARHLNMTYQGLHKKLKLMGIDKPD